MKRILSFALTALLCTGLYAQQYHTRLTNAQGNEIKGATGFIEFLDGDQVAVNRIVYNSDGDWDHAVTDTMPASELRSADFLSYQNRLWAPNFAEHIYPSASRPDDFGYGNVMHGRDLLTEDMTAPGDGLNWYNAWLQARLYPNYAAPYLAWTYHCMGIMQCADVIAAIDAENATAAQKGVLAEAYATRALLYLDFARMYEFLPNERSNGITSKGNNVTGLTVPIIDETTQAAIRCWFQPVPPRLK